MPKIYNISIPRKFTQNGAEKTAWNNVGKLIKFDATQTKPEGFILEMFMFPDTKFGIFEQKPKDSPMASAVQRAETTQSSLQTPENMAMNGSGEAENGFYPEKKEEIKVEDIPF